MANNSLKFFKGDFSALGSYVNGGIYFDTSSHQIRVGNGSGYDAFGSNIKDVTSEKGVLTFSFWGGRGDIKIDLKDCASATAVAAELKKVTDRVAALESNVGVPAKDAEYFANYAEYKAAMEGAGKEFISEEDYNGLGPDADVKIKSPAVKASGVFKDVADVKSSVGTLGGRVDTLEEAVSGESGLGGRVDTLESDVNALEAADVALGSRIDTLKSTVDAIKIPVTGVQGDDKILSLVDGKIHSTLSMTYGKDTDDKYYIKLVGKDGEISSIDCTDFLVDGMLKGVRKVTITEDQATSERPAGDYFLFDFDGIDHDIYVPLSDFAVSVYKAGKDLDLVGDTFNVALDADVTIAGGPLANNVVESGDAWPWTNNDGAKYIPKGMSLTDILTGLFLKVKNGTVGTPSYSWNPALAAPTVTLGGKTSQTLEVGSTVAVAITPSSSVSGNTAKVTVSASDGYFTATDGSWNAGSYSQTVAGTVSGTASAAATYNSSSVSNGDTVTVNAGTNTLSATSSGITASVADFNAATIYASTNTKKVLDGVSTEVDVDHFADDKVLTSKASATVTGARACWYGFLDTAPAGDALNNAYFRGITATSPSGNGIKKSLTAIKTGTEIIAKKGFKGLVIAIPSGEIKSLIAKGATTDLIPAASVKEVDIEGANSYTAAKYKVYYCAWAEGGDDATYVVTLK